MHMPRLTAVPLGQASLDLLTVLAGLVTMLDLMLNCKTPSCTPCNPLLRLPCLQASASGGQQLDVPAQGPASPAQQQADTATPGSGGALGEPGTEAAVPETRLSQGSGADAAAAPPAAQPAPLSVQLNGTPGSPSVVKDDDVEEARMVPSSSAAAGLGAEQPAGLQRTESAQATTAAPAAEQAGSSPGPVRTVCALINSGEQPALATAAAAAAEQAAPAAGQAPPARDPSMLVQSGAEPAEADSADQQQPPPDVAQSASAKITDALTAVPAAMVGMGSQQGPAEFQEGAQRGPRGAAVACSEPCTGLSAASQDGASSAASAADATQGGVLVAQGSQEADGHDGAPTAASKVRHWTGCSPPTCTLLGYRTLQCSAEQHAWQLGQLACSAGTLSTSAGV